MHGVTVHLRDDAVDVDTGGRLDVVLNYVRLNQFIAGHALALPLFLPRRVQT